MVLSDLLQDQNPWWRDGAVRRARGYPVRRELQPKILHRVLRKGDRRATLLFGPRQIGKTVLLLQLADDLLHAGWPAQNLTYFDFSDARITGDVTAREIVEAKPVGLNPVYPRIFLLDEIRSAPNWDLWLKQAVDARIGRIVATDSAIQRYVSRESGLGRWDELYMEGLTFREFIGLHGGVGEEIETVLRRFPNLLERYLTLGGFPKHALQDDVPEIHRRLRGDIAKRAILAVLARPGAYSERVRDLFVYLLQNSGAEFNAEAQARELNASAVSARELEGRLTYFQEDLASDFVFEDQRGPVAIEVTSGVRLQTENLERLRQAAKKLRADRRLLIHGGVIEETVEGVEAVPIQRFLLDSSSFLERARRVAVP